jgi:hypothetical protein
LNISSGHCWPLALSLFSSSSSIYPDPSLPASSHFTYSHVIGLSEGSYSHFAEIRDTSMDLLVHLISQFKDKYSPSDIVFSSSIAYICNFI